MSKATAAAAQGVNRRRSNVVKEVERLKENREKRRAQQAQILEDQEVLRNKDPGNPNWEFLQMILDYKVIIILKLFTVFGVLIVLLFLLIFFLL